MNNRVLKIYLIILLFFSLHFAQAQSRSFVVPLQMAQNVGFVGTVLQNDALVYTLADATSPPLGKLKSGDQVSAGGLDLGFRKVKLLLQNQQVIEGYMQSESLSVKQSMDVAQAQVTPSPIPTTSPPRPPLKTSMPNPQTLDTKNSISLGYAPAYELYRYGTFQHGAQAAFQRRLSDLLSWNVPVMYAKGGGFSILSAGVGVGFDLIQKNAFRLIVQPQLLTDFLYSSQKKVSAASLGLSWALRYQLSQSMGIGLEPYSVMAMIWNNREIPWNLRSRSTVYCYYSF